MSDTNTNDSELRRYRDLGFATQAMAAGCDDTRANKLRETYAEQEPKRAAKIAVIRTDTLAALKG